MYRTHTIDAVEFNGRAVLCRRDGLVLFGFWSSALSGWVRNITDSEITLWSTKDLASTYAIMNRDRLLAAQVVQGKQAQG